ncbi:terminase large subunit [Roseovarius sp. B08]|uniref:terminase large subunit n=1 Tax=Roseovarius sp. B08 TaxID=3449223 RepID=UPI003EDBB56F
MRDAALETPITLRAMDWVEAILSNKVPSCRRVKLACKRFKKDLKRAGTDGFPFVFDVEASEHMCAFLEALPHTEGQWAARGETINLIGWQAFMISQIGGWRHMITGLRRFRTVYIEVPRKNGKSTLLAGVGLYFLCVDGEPGAKVYSAASSSDQAREVFDRARAIALAEMPDGTTLDTRLNLKVEQHKIKTTDVAAMFRPVASQTKSKDGKNPHCAIIDELHEHEKRDVWDSMDQAMGSREQPLLIAITTAGHNTAGICYEQRKYLQRVLDGVFDDETYFGLIFEADEGDEPGDPETWAKANPSMGIAKSQDYMRQQWVKASASPAAMGEFLRKHLNVWTSVGAAALDMDAWRAGEKLAVPMLKVAGRKALIGVDLATRLDPASVVLHVPDDDLHRLYSWHFLPHKIVETEGNEHLAGWYREGFLHSTPGAELNLNIVESLVDHLAGVGDGAWGWADLPSFDVEMVVYDAMFAAQMAANWETKGINAVELRSRAANLNEPFQKLIARVDDGRVINDGNPVLTWMAGNTLMRQVQGGDYIFPGKLAPEDKIDGIVAACNAMWPILQVADSEEKGVVTQGFVDV